MAKSSVWNKYSDSDLNDLNRLSAEYKDFISRCKTERECCDFAIRIAEESGYKSLEDARKCGKLEAGDKVWSTSQNKALVLVHVGKQPIESGMNILGAHMDSPRLDLKQNPLFEKDGLALLDTHYDGGIKKYQWVTIPLALHGVVVLKDGSIKNVCIGEEDSDPVFCITDILPYLGAKQMEKKASDVVEGENLDVLCGNRPLPKNAEDDAEDGEKAKEQEADAVKKYALSLLEEKYGITEDDFLSAEIEVVPAGCARDLGFDRSMVLGYGQDDRVCAYTSLKAQLDLTSNVQDGIPDRTCVCVLVDKEEIGSVGASGMDSMFFENTIAEVMELAGEEGLVKLRRALASSAMLSSDVSAAVDPFYESAFEAKNSAYLGQGLVFNKYTGARGKSGSNDARAEYIASIRRVMDDDGVSFQTAELGRVDEGGGGTIAFIPARYGMDVIDSGVPVLSMHSPWEATSKADIYEAYRGYRAFLRSMA